MGDFTIPFDLHLPSFVAGVLVRLRNSGHAVHIVGGALRDTFLERPVPDWDISTSATSDQIGALFIDTRSYRLKHETVTLIVQGRRVEITPFRGPEKTLQGDLARRDFTINAMAYDPVCHVLIDPWEGQKDLERRMVKATGNPESRFQEDPIRLLRGVRLAVELDFRIHEDTLMTMHSMASNISHAPRERVRDELFKILLCDRPSRGFRTLMKTGLLGFVLPELAEGRDVAQNPYHRYTVFTHTMETLARVPSVLHLRLAALLHDIAKPRVRTHDDGQWRFFGHEEAGAVLAEEIMERLRVSRSLIKSVVRLVRYHMIQYSPEWGDPAVRRLLRKVGSEHIPDLLTLRRADLQAHGTSPEPLGPLNDLEQRTHSLIREKAVTRLTHLAVNGRTVMRVLNLGSGPMVGRCLDELLEVVTERPGLNNERDLIEILLKMKGD
ncbi:MAG: CCA tRNA nucleotidyltransferase [Desulfatiglandaceae bacterium]|jgi:putative nucleotidyltransferase with HDIG domain